MTVPPPPELEPDPPPLDAPPPPPPPELGGVLDVLVGAGVVVAGVELLAGAGGFASVGRLEVEGGDVIVGAEPED